MRVKYILILFIICCLFGCETVTDNVIEKTIGTEDYKKIEEIDLLILEYRITKEPERLLSAEDEIKELVSNKAYNKEYEALLYGLAGEIEYIKGNKQGVKNNLKEVEKRSRYVEYFFLLSAFMEEEFEKKIEICEQGLSLANTTGKINLYLALLYFEDKNFNKAAAYFDDAFETLHSSYSAFYKKERDLAYQFIDTADVDAGAIELIEVDVVQFYHIISLTLIRTDFLNHITADKSTDPALLLETLKSYDYIHSSIESIEEVCERKDIAYFLLNIISYLENDPALKEKYKKQYIENDMESPVPDVPAREFYFTAVLVLVEKEIMELPNGIHFLPHNTMSGIEVNELLEKIKDMYY